MVVPLSAKPGDVVRVANNPRRVFEVRKVQAEVGSPGLVWIAVAEVPSGRIRTCVLSDLAPMEE